MISDLYDTSTIQLEIAICTETLKNSSRLVGESGLHNCRHLIAFIVWAIALGKLHRH